MTRRATIVRFAGTIERDEPDATHAPGEVLMRVEAVGICGSDMHAYHGRDPRRNPPLILGHELAGTIPYACRVASMLRPM